MKKLNIYTDGACSGNPGLGGYGVVVYDESNTNVSEGHYPSPKSNTYAELGSHALEFTTNNIMELSAMWTALTMLTSPHSIDLEEVEIFCDSQYVTKGILEWMPGWKRKNWDGVANSELWKSIDKQLTYIRENRKFNLTITHVYGHSGLPGNEYADHLAVYGKESRKTKELTYPKEGMIFKGGI